MSNLFVTYIVDFIQGSIATALASENVPELKRVTQQFRHASDRLKSFAMAVGGEPVLDLGSIGCISVPADRMTELPQIIKSFENETESTLSVGVGMSLSESYTAAKFASIQGGDQIALYHEEMDDQLHTAENPQPDELAGLAKAAESQSQQSSLVGQKKIDQHGEGGKFTAKPAETHKPTKAPQPPKPDTDGMDLGPSSLESQPPQQEQQPQPEQEQEQDPRAMVVAALQEIKRQAPVLEQLKQSNPDAFDAVKDVVQAMIVMAQGMAAQAPEAEADGASEPAPAPVSKSESESQLQKDLMPGGAGDDKPESDFDPEQLAIGIQREMEEHGLDEERAKEITEDHLTENPNYYKVDKAEIAHQKFPVGHVNAPGGGIGVNTSRGSVKVQVANPQTGADTHEGHINGRAGLIQSQTKLGQPASARKPGAPPTAENVK